MEKNRNKKIDSILLLGIMLITMSIISFEILLTRLFSTILMYHFAFLISSIVILGMGLGGLIFYQYTQREENQISNQKLMERFYTPVLFPISYVLIVLIIYLLPYVNIIAYTLLAIIPFLLGGGLLAKIYYLRPEMSHQLYWADLTGAAIGSIMIVKLMNRLGFVGSAFVVVLLATVGVLLFQIGIKEAKVRRISLLMAAVIIGLLLQPTLLNQIQSSFNAYYSSPNTVISYLKNSSKKITGIDFIGWDALSRTDVIETLDEREKIVITDGGASAPMIRFNGNLDEVSDLKDEIGFIPFAFGGNKNTLVIGSGGGKDILLALLGNSEQIDAVEINPKTIQAAYQYGEFNGNIYQNPKVQLSIQDGRSFIEAATEKYDNIYLSMVMANAVEYSALALSEGYVFTTEAFEKYFSKLTDDGKLNFVMHSEDDLLRGLNTGIKVLLEQGVAKEKILDYFVIVNGLSSDEAIAHGDKFHMPLLMLKKKPFTEDEYTAIAEIIEKQGRQAIHMKNLTSLDLYVQFAAGEIPLRDLYQSKRVNLTPVTDQSPFFYHFFKGISATLILLLVISSLVLKKVLSFKWKKSNGFYLMYFALLGIAFMLVEIPLIQKMVLFLGNPITAFSSILFILLVSGGLGSLVSQRGVWQRPFKNHYLPLLLSAFFIMIQIFSMGYVIKNHMNVGFAYKLIMVTMIIAPMGFFMGMPFPKGLQQLKELNVTKEIPFVWGVNGIASVLGATLALSISILWGYSVSEAVAGIIYIFLFAKGPINITHEN